MDPAQWIATFRLTHEQAKRGSLGPPELKKYLGMRDELARSLMSAQRLEIPEGVAPRRALKVAHVFPIEISNVYRTTTREISCTGFTALVAAMFKEGDSVPWSLTVNRTDPPIVGDARVVSAPRQSPTSTRLSVVFVNLDEPKLLRLEQALFDAALSRF